MTVNKNFVSMGIVALFLCASISASEAVSRYECVHVDTQSGISKQHNEKNIAEIYQLFKAWRSAIEVGDAKKIASLVTEDAEFWSNGAPPLKGRRALEAVFKQFLAKFIFSQKYDCYELILRGDIAFIRGLERNTKIPREGGTAIFTRQRAFSIVRQSRDGKWRFARGMTNLPDTSSH